MQQDFNLNKIIPQKYLFIKQIGDFEPKRQLDNFKSKKCNFFLILE